MIVNPYLTFGGRCKEAFEFYAKVLGAEIPMMMTFGESPAAEHVPSDSHDKIMHARLVKGDLVLLGSDCTPEHPYEGVKGCSIALQVKSADEAERVFDALSDGGNITMPLDKTFWAERFGMFVDRYGVPWMVNCEFK